MSLAVWIGVALLGGLGAVGRMLVADGAAARVGRSFAWGTLVVNLSGAFVLGVVVGAAVHGDARRLVATGLLGSFTTFSGWALESERLARRGSPALGAVNLAVSLVLGLALVWAGREIGGLL
jgi:fluoride exporter